MKHNVGLRSKNYTFGLLDQKYTFKLLTVFVRQLDKTIGNLKECVKKILPNFIIQECLL